MCFNACRTGKKGVNAKEIANETGLECKKKAKTKKKANGPY